MKVLLALAVLATSVTAVAASDSSINDLQYLPDAGTLFGNTQYSHLKFEDGKSNTLLQKVGYSLANNLFVDANVSYTHTDSGTSEFKGLDDIVFNGRYRLSEASGNRFDLIGGVSISPDDSKVDGDEGNSYSGGHALRIGAEYGNKTKERQWSVFAAYVHNLEAKTEYEDADETDTDDAHGQLSFGANLLTRIGEHCFIKTFAAVDFEEEYDTDSDSGDYENSGSTIWRLGGEYQHLLSQNLFVSAGATSLIIGSSDSSPIMQYHVGTSYQF